MTLFTMKKGSRSLKEGTPYTFTGMDGVKDLYTLIMQSWSPKDAYFIVSAPLDSFTKMEPFFLNTVHKKRVQDRVSVKMIVNSNAQSYGLVRKNMPFTQVRYLDHETTAEYGVLNDLLFIVNYSEQPYGVLIKDQNLADTFKTYFNIIWQQGRTIQIPPLVKTNQSIRAILARYKKQNPLVVTDVYNYSRLNTNHANVVCIKNNKYLNVVRLKKIIDQNGHGVVIGVGGCTALDIARACSSERVPSVLIPTILSTVCISVDKSVLNVDGDVKTFNTVPPSKVILPTKEVMNSDRSDVVRWSQAGFGDLFAKIGASIDVTYRKTKGGKDTMSLDKVRRNIPEVFDAVEYVLEKFDNYNEKDLQALAVFLHEASVSIIIRDTFELSGGAEHNLAYILEKKYLPKRIKIEHGTLVSVGALVEFKLFGEITGDDLLYEKMRTVFETLGLPTSYRQLNDLGLSRSALVKGMKDLKKFNTLMSAHVNKSIGLLDSVFQSKKHPV